MDSKIADGELIANFLATHDRKLREEIILRYIPLVHFVLGRLGLSQSMGADYEDAASQGLMGLIEAVDRYNPEFGTQFSTYATLRVRGKVIDHLRSLDWLSRGARQRARRVQDAVSTLWQEYSRLPSDQELSNYLKVDLNQVQKALLDSSRMIVSLDTMVDLEGESESSLYDVLPDDSQVEPSEEIEENELKLRMIAALQELSEREQLVLSLYYYEELTFKEIGAVLEVSESRVCQIHSRAVMSLRAMMAQNPIDADSGAGQNSPVPPSLPGQPSEIAQAVSRRRK